MPIEIFVISGMLAAVLTSLAKSAVQVIRQEYRNHQERHWKRQGLMAGISAHHDVPYQDILPGRHRLEGCAAAHEICADDAPCAYRGWQNGMVHADYYIERAAIQRAAIERAAAERAAIERAEREVEYERSIPWPREEDVSETDRMAGLLCGYRTPSSFPGLSTPLGSSVDFTADSTSTPRSPTSVGR
jgi:hypothetical protein